MVRLFSLNKTEEPENRIWWRTWKQFESMNIHGNEEQEGESKVHRELKPFYKHYLISKLYSFVKSYFPDFQNERNWCPDGILWFPMQHKKIAKWGQEPCFLDFHSSPTIILRSPEFRYGYSNKKNKTFFKNSVLNLMCKSICF